MRSEVRTNNMGYTVAVEGRSKDLIDRMFAFLGKEWRPWPVVNGEGPDAPSYVRPPRIDDLSYHCGGPYYIGCDYNCQGPERYYLYAFIRWLATKVGKRTPFTKTPYYIYDGREPTPVFVNTEAEGHHTVDKWGVPIKTPKSRKIKGVWEIEYELINLYGEPDTLNIIRQEIQRLDALWSDGQG